MPHVSRPDRLSAAAGQARASAISAAEFRGAFDTVTTTVSVIATDGPAGTAGLTRSASLATFDCEFVEVRDLGTHSIFVAQVVATRTRDGGEPLVYRRRAYATTRPL